MWQNQLKELRIPLAIGGISILLILVSITLLIKSVQTTTPIQFSSDSASESGVLGQATSQITVDIQGAVARPGVYELPEGSRVEDALSAAGGLTSEADAERISQTINRAAKLSDGAKLYFPKKSDSTSHNSYPSLVSVNASSQSDLEALPGIGPVTAKKIIAGRPWQTLDELVTKKAMSQSLLTKLKDQLSL